MNDNSGNSANDNKSIGKALDMLNEATKNFADGISSILERLTELSKRQADKMKDYDK